METGEQFGRTAPGSATSLSIASLHPDYTYTYVVAALTAVGSGPISTFRSIKMPEDGEKLILQWKPSYYIIVPLI